MNDNNANNSTVDSVVIVYGSGLSIHQDLADSIQRQVKEVVPYLPFGEVLTLEEICGKEFWNNYSKGEKIKVGQYVSYLVACDLLPLVSVPGKHEYPKLYMRK